jgi:hypothetical protein
MGLASVMAGPSRAGRGHDRGVGVANHRVRRVLAAIGAGILAVPLTAGVAQAAPTGPSGPVVVVSGLNNPRQLSLVSGIELLVAEAGKGGSFEVPGGGPEGPVFIGTTGSISAVFFPQFVHNTSPHRIVTGLLSGAAKDGSAATGSDGVSATRLSGPIYIQQTWFPPNLLPNTLPKDQLGQLLRARPFGPAKPFADITAFEAKHDPDGKGFDSDPYAVLVVGVHLLVADAAGNDVLRVDRRGHVSLFHVFPNVTTGACANQFDPAPPFRGCNFVPTSLTTDRWGNVYVGGLSSLTPGEAQVVKLDPSGRHVLRVWTGFTAVTGVAVGWDGTLYVSQLFAPQAHPVNPMVQGVLTKIRNGHRTNTDVPFPAGIALDGHGNLFVSAFSIAPDTGLGVPNTSGQVWRLRS